MDTVDDTPFQIRPIDEPGMEKINTIGFGEYDYYRSGIVAVEKMMWGIVSSE